MTPAFGPTCVLLLLGLASGEGTEAKPEPTRTPSPPVFREAAKELGLEFVHRNGATGERYFPEVFGAGVGLLDFDGDGDLDVYLVQSGSHDPDERALTSGDRLFRNDLVAGSPGSLRFVDVTEDAGIRATGYGMGVTTGDYDRDGDADLYVTNFGENQLWRNDGGHFSEQTRAAGLEQDEWSVAAVFFDYDRDGWPDLYVGNYVRYRLAINQRCTAPAGYLDYCTPRSYSATPDRLYRNRGDGTFEDVSARAGLGSAAAGAGLGALAADLDGDDWLDLYVANDETPNHLWLNRRNGSFTEAALITGIAVSGSGEPEASMGVDVADFDDDGDLDLFLTHFSQEKNTLYVNEGGLFDDGSLASGLATPSWPNTGFGTAFFDYDNDGRLDLLVVNGAVILDPELRLSGDPDPLRQPNQLYRNSGGGRFEEVEEPSLTPSETSRGAAFGDLDNDGDTDVVVTNNGGPARLLLNRLDNRRRWTGLELVGGGDNRFPVGAFATLELDDGSHLRRDFRVAVGYASSQEPRLLFGIGERDIRGLVVHWPGGHDERFAAPPIGRYSRIVEGEGPGGR